MRLNYLFLNRLPNILRKKYTKKGINEALIIHKKEIMNPSFEGSYRFNKENMHIGK